ncbi:MAG: hypothetical protein AABX65_02960 [Nanoarchaeota archaeon]
MISNSFIQGVALAAVFIEAIGILLAEKKSALLLGLFTILTIIIFFIV